MSDTKLGEPGSAAWAPSGALMYEHAGRVEYIPKGAFPIVLRALIAQAGGVEVEVQHRTPQVSMGAGSESQPMMLKEHAVFVDPISVARKVAAGPALLLPMEGSEP